MADCFLSNFDLAKLYFDRSNIIRNFKKFFSLLCSEEGQDKQEKASK